ncbi:hypothetical protein [Jeotgalibacillus aurantiacus]|uniref:hypothetical protein n=1 Tax=Jeotgalibacillus aurantiacus TaxID=2763266 RepID=UPI001D0A3952|nr:hypothetical protein [Jeotgalibacillus aurantiacus]
MTILFLILGAVLFWAGIFTPISNLYTFPPAFLFFAAAIVLSITRPGKKET